MIEVQMQLCENDLYSPFVFYFIFNFRKIQLSLLYCEFY